MELQLDTEEHQTYNAKVVQKTNSNACPLDTKWLRMRMTPLEEEEEVDKIQSIW
jgi:hypothetical protein